MTTITVKSARKDGRVAFFEKDLSHPDGQAFVRGDQKPVEAGDTAALRRAIRQGNLVEVGTALGTQVTPTAKQTPPTLLPSPVPALKRTATDTAPWEGYDDASSEEIITRLRGMEQAERDKALAYERGNKNRVTITRVQWNS